MLPSLFVSHGAPTLALSDAPARRFLERLADVAPRPSAILVASAHWEAPHPAVNAPAINDTIHDFYGFPAELYRLRYSAPGAPAVAERVVALLSAAGMKGSIDRRRGLDHGAWVPLLLGWPAADIPVAQISLIEGGDAAAHLALGRALAPLRTENVLVIGSGSFTHNLRELRRDGTEPEPGWTRDFSEWMDRALVGGRVDDLIDYRRLAPHAARNHPTDEHLLPLFVALGAAGEGAAAERLHSSVTLGALRMDAYAFRGTA